MRLGSDGLRTLLRAVRWKSADAFRRHRTTRARLVAVPREDHRAAEIVAELGLLNRLLDKTR